MKGLATILRDRKDLRDLEADVDRLLKENPDIASKIKERFKTKNTKQNSLGNIARFFREEEICLHHCSHALYQCPKRPLGDRLILTYDKDRDRITTVHAPCSFRRKKRENLERISPSDISVDQTYQALVSLRGEPSPLSQLPDTNRIRGIFHHNLTKRREGEEIFKGFALYTSSISDPSKISRLRKALAYRGAYQGYSVAYIDFPTFCESFFSQRIDDVADKEIVLSKRKHRDLLFLTGYDQIPNYYDKSKREKRLYSLLKARRMPHKRTIRSISYKEALTQKTNYLLKGRRLRSDILQLWKSLVDLIPIRDPDIKL